MPSTATKPVAAAVWEKRDQMVTIRISGSMKAQLAEEAAALDRTLSRHIEKRLMESMASQCVRCLTLSNGNVLHRLTVWNRRIGKTLKQLQVAQ